MDQLVTRLRIANPTINFEPAAVASWSPVQQRVNYVASSDPPHIWALLHELGHALKKHTMYQNDLMLISKEAEAWECAQKLSKNYGIAIDPEHIQDCMDTYRDWLYRRSICPRCDSHGLQTAAELYRCYNCQASWQVSNHRFCRPYRALAKI